MSQSNQANSATFAPSKAKVKVPQRQIRAKQPSSLSVIVYQAYNAEIAGAAVAAQRLDASPLFLPDRMTWIKPSWCWVNYRSGYAQKDANQTNILALEVKRDGFEEMLRHARLSPDPFNGGGPASKVSGGKVVVQWDPERGPALQRLDYRSIQIGLRGSFVRRLIKEWIVSIADVTEQARLMKEATEKNSKITVDELVQRGIFPGETIYNVPQDIFDILQMGDDSSTH